MSVVCLYRGYLICFHIHICLSSVLNEFPRRQTANYSFKLIMLFTATDNSAVIEHRLSDVQMFLAKWLLNTLTPLVPFCAKDILHSKRKGIVLKDSSY